MASPLSHSPPAQRAPLKGALLPLAALMLAAALWPSGARAQEQRYTLALRGVPLDQAIEQFVRATGRAVAYDPALVRGQRSYCAAEGEAAEAVLQCILEESGLDYYRLSSGTYVLTPRPELAPQPGFLAGTVVDAGTGAPLAHAHVLLEEADVGALTNRAGQFAFPPLLPGRYAVRISHLGYASWQDTLLVAPDTRTRTEAALVPEAILITPVVVDGHEQRWRAQHLGRETVRADEPAIGGVAGSPQVYPALSALPGVRMHDVTADVHLQGGDAGAHELRLDGVPVYLPRSTLGLVGPFGAFALGRLSVEKAGFDAAQGSHTAGVLQAEHALAARDGLDVQLDPLSLNGRLQLAPSLAGGRALALMAAGRIGLWEAYRPTRLHAMLDAWSAPDPFLVLAPLLRSASPDLRLAEDPLQRLRAGTNPAVHFSDLHGALRLRLGPLRTLHASAYRGTNRLTGGVLSSRAEFAAGDPYAAPFTVLDDYAWHNSLAQVRYEAVLGSHTLFSAQLMGSRYRLHQRYEVLDSLLLVPGGTDTPQTSLRTRPVEDGNEVRTLAAMASADHATPRHHLRAGVETAWTESGFDLSDVRFRTTSSDSTGDDVLPEAYQALRRASHHRATGWRVAGFVSDDLRLAARLKAEMGLRLTYLHAHTAVYAEPRLALVYEREAGLLGSWSARTAVGLYRQYVGQMDISRFNAGAMLPSVRIWLPVDGTVGVPRVVHLTHTTLLQPAPRWTLRLEGYYKYEPHGRSVRYADAAQFSRGYSIPDQALFLVQTQGASYGTALSLRWEGTRTRLQGLYEYGRATRQSPVLFGGRSVPAPWNEPHRAELGLDWNPVPNFTLAGRARGVWGRSWGFRQAYYDYFGHGSGAVFPPYDFSRPDDHVLPPLYEVDLSAAYRRPFGPAALAFRIEVLNALDRQNTADWRLLYESGVLHKHPRYLHPRLPSLAVHLSF